MPNASGYPSSSVSSATTPRLAAFLAALLTTLATLGSLASSAAANTAVTSNITTNMTWTKAGSPYDLDASSLQVKEGATLTIEPGVTVDFNSTTAATFTIVGTIKAIGTASNPIVFTSHQALEGLGTPGQYLGVVVSSGNAASKFSHVDFYYGGNGSSNYYFYGVLKPRNGSSITVDHSTFENNLYSGLFVWENSTAHVSYSTFEHNGDGISTGSNGVLSVTHSTIANNVQDGVFVNNGGVAGAQQSFTYNTITQNGNAGLRLSIGCTTQPSVWPHGEYNNIYHNNGSEELQHQIYAPHECEALPVDWRNNYWGSDVYFYRNDPQCANTTTPFLGHLAYTWDKPKYSYWVPKGPIKSGSHTYTTPYTFQCGWDTFKIGPNEFLTSPVLGAPEPSVDSLIGGGPSAFAPNLVEVECEDPVNCVTGNFTESRTDLRVPGLNGGLSFRRTYNSRAGFAGYDSPLGYGWAFEFGETLSLDPSGTAATITNADGSKVTFTEIEGAWTAPAWVQATLVHNEDGTFTYTLPSQRSFKFSSEGKLLSISDRNGNETTLSYSEGKLTTVTDPSGRKLSFAYNAAGRIESVTSPAGRSVHFEYDSAGNLTSASGPGEVSEGYGYDAIHQMTSLVNPRGGETKNVYDEAGRVTSQTDPLKHTATWAYHAEDTEMTDPTGSVMKVQFEKNLPTAITRAYGTEDAATTKYEYDEDLNPVAVIDPNGHKTEFGYDSEGNRTSVKDALGDEAKRTYDGKHEIVSMTTPGGETTTIARDAKGNPEAISRPGPGETTQTIGFSFDSRGLLESVVDPLKRTWSFGYDSHGDRTSETDPAGDTWTKTYNEDSRLVSIVTPRGNVEGAEPSEYTIAIERDAQGRPLKVTDPLGNPTEYAYDAAGNLVSLTDAKGHTAKFTYDADNERTKAERASGATIEIGYDANGRVVSRTDGNGHTTEYVRNPLGLPVEVVDPLERKTSGEFDPAGNLKSLTDAAGRTTSYSYDAANRLTEVSYSDGTTPAAEFEWNADGQVTGMTDGSGTSSYAYDRLGRLAQAEGGHGNVVGYAYDLAEELTGIAYPNGKSVSRAFDEAGRLESVTDWLGGTTGFSYDADSNLLAIAFPEGTGNADEYAYDRADRMSEARMTRGSETLASLSYARDALGQVEGVSSTGLPGAAEASYGYDEDNRLTAAGAASFEYDAADNLTKAPGTVNSYDAANQLEAGTGVAYSYDKVGERTKATPEAGPATSYGYDQAGRLISVERPEEGEATAIAESFGYDGAGVMASRTVSGATSYLSWDRSGGLPLLLDDGQRSYVYGPDGLPVEQIEGETPTYLHHDQLGSTRLLTSAGGAATGAFSYTPYGTLEAAAGSATTPLGFAGQYTDAPTGLQYLRARFYDPGTGQFLSRDPIEAITWQAYVYAGDNPVNGVDPSGLETVGLCLGGEIGFKLGLSGSLCVTGSSAWEFGFTVSAGVTHSIGSPNVDTSLGLEVTDAERMCELAGFSASVNAAAGDGLGGYAEFSEGDGVKGIKMGPAAGEGVKFGTGMSTTSETHVSLPDAIMNAVKTAAEPLSIFG